MRFEIVHEFDRPLIAIERALLSPELGKRLVSRLTTIESVETLMHDLSQDELKRILRFQASAPLSMFKKYAVARDAMAWEEHWHYRLSEHSSKWQIHIKTEWKHYFDSEGTYTLFALSGQRTRRVVAGAMHVHVAVIGAAIERVALTEVRRTYDAEAETLVELSAC